MQSASASPGALNGASFLWAGARRSVGGGLLWSAVLTVLLTFTIARSTVTAAWVDGIGVITVVAVGAALFMALLALTPLRSAVALGIGGVVAPVAAVVAAFPTIHALHPLEPAGLGMVRTWWARLADGTAAQDPSFYLVLICLLMFVTGAWLSWCVLRWRKPMLGLVPGAAAFATNLLNFPTDQNGYTLAVLVLTLGLLLWSTYSGSIATATHAQVKLSGDARWDFWESGLLAMAGLIFLGVLLPPLSTSDRTTQVESGLFTNWAELQQRLGQRIPVAGGLGGGGATGFSATVALGGPLQRTHDVVFTYTISGTYSGPRYFRGLDVNVTTGGQWEYPPSAPLYIRNSIGKNQVPAYTENYQKLAVASFNVDMVAPPTDFQDLLFYPGRLHRIDRATTGFEVPVTKGSARSGIDSIDRLSSAQPGTSAGKYTVDVEYSTASAAELQAAGSAYPGWVGAYAYVADGYRSPDVLQRIHALALSIVTSAGATNPYDEATAIESFLRGSNFTYSLDPPQPPDGSDPMSYFLFNSHSGYCEYFAAAMGDMLRSLGVPTRLVNGFGPGQFDAASGRFVVRGQDAHTWVESYFPGYGWIPFEPTNDNVYTTIARGTTGANTCLRDNGCDLPVPTGSIGGVQLPNPGRRGGNTDAGGGLGGQALSLRNLDPGTVSRIAAGLIAILLLVLAGVVRYLRPRTVMAVWQRTGTLARLSGAENRPGETPLEFGRRLQGAFPDAFEAAGALAGGFATAAYAPPELATSARSGVMEAWAEIRPVLLRGVWRRLRRTRRRTL